MVQEEERIRARETKAEEYGIGIIILQAYNGGGERDGSAWVQPFKSFWPWSSSSDGDSAGFLRQTQSRSTSSRIWHASNTGVVGDWATPHISSG